MKKLITPVDDLLVESLSGFASLLSDLVWLYLVWLYLVWLYVEPTYLTRTKKILGKAKNQVAIVSGGRFKYAVFN